MKKRGFTILELMIAVVVMGMMMLSAMSYMGMFMEMSEEAEMKDKFSYYSKELQKNLSDIETIKKVMSGEDGHQIISGENWLYPVKYNLGSTNPKDIPSGASDDRIKIEKFWGTDSINYDPFLDGLYVYADKNSTAIGGDIIVEYRKYTLIYFGDSLTKRIVASKLNNGTDMTTMVNEMFTPVGGFLVLNTTYGGIEPYFRSNWNKIRKKILMTKINTKREIIDTVKDIEADMTKVQERINDWATIQASYASYDTTGTGNTLDIDYFITCQSDTEGRECLNITLDSDLFIPSKKTLLRADDGLNDMNNGGLSLKRLADDKTPFEEIPNEYGFIIFESGNIGSPFNINDFMPTTKGCDFDITNGDIDINVQGAAVLSPFRNSVNDVINIDTDYCTLSNNLGNFVPRNMNPFGFPVLFTNWTPYNELGVPEDNTFVEKDNVRIDIGVNTPVSKLVSSIAKNVKSAPYDAKIFTILPNGEVIAKQVYAKGF